uniref:Uncharacterized protein n=1 Tax=Leersia perrieri TaxID=77586 RepID=A0A0D9XV88_9ORYZ
MGKSAKAGTLWPPCCHKLKGPHWLLLLGIDAPVARCRPAPGVTPVEVQQQLTLLLNRLGDLIGSRRTRLLLLEY